MAFAHSSEPIEGRCGDTAERRHQAAVSQQPAMTWPARRMSQKPRRSTILVGQRLGKPMLFPSPVIESARAIPDQKVCHFLNGRKRKRGYESRPRTASGASVDTITYPSSDRPSPSPPPSRCNILQQAQHLTRLNTRRTNNNKQLTHANTP